MRLRRQAAFLVLTFILAAPWVATAEPRLERRDWAESRVSTVSEFLSDTWSLVQSLWGTASACDAGPRIDPLGCPQPTTDEGARIDPLG
jgi:hypothetical protein